jgi:protein tyrosine/serine phosphatase
MSTKPIDNISIRNFREINPWLYRGGQPLAEEYVQLKELGIKTVVCLRWSNKTIEEEKASVEGCGLKFISIPLNYLNGPTQDSIDKFFAVIDDTSKHPFYIHCLHGSDRTGLLIALYRMTRQGWSADKAYEEMKECGFHRIRMHHFKTVLYEFAKKED